MIIDQLKEIIEVHQQIDSDIFEYNQDILPDNEEDFDWGRCGCAMHVCKLYDINYDDIHSWYKDYIFGTSAEITIAADFLGLPKPKGFTVNDVIIRCNHLIELQEKVNA